MKRRRVPATTTPTRRVRAFFLLPSPRSPGLTPAEQLALTLRRDATVSGRCVCGATMPRTRARRGAHAHLWIVHADDCPAAGSHVDAIERRLGNAIEYDAVVVEVEVAA